MSHYHWDFIFRLVAEMFNTTAFANWVEYSDKSYAVPYFSNINVIFHSNKLFMDTIELYFFTIRK